MKVLALIPFCVVLCAGLGEKGTEGVALYQGHVLGNENRCESICANLCDSPDCLSVCHSKFCSETESTTSSWTFLVLMVLVVGVMAAVLRLVFQKMIERRDDSGDLEASRYYHSL